MLCAGKVIRQPSPPSTPAAPASGAVLTPDGQQQDARKNTYEHGVKSVSPSQLVLGKT